MNWIEYLNSQDEPAPATYLLLKSGRDQWSNLRWPDLMTKLPPELCGKLLVQVPDKQDRTIVARWVLRGLTLDKSIAKMEVDKNKQAHFRESNRAEKTIREIIG